MATAYRTVETRTWDDEWFRGLSDRAKLLWLYLLTGPNTTPVPGLFRAGEAQLAEELGWSVEAFREAFLEAFPDAFAEGDGDPRIKVDWKARVVWLKRAVRPSNRPTAPNVVKGWAGVVRDRLPECALVREALKVIEIRTLGLVVDKEAFRKAFREAFPDALPRTRTLNQNPEPEPPPPTPSSGEVVVDEDDSDLGGAHEAMSDDDGWAEFQAIRVDHVTWRSPDGLSVRRGLTKEERRPKGFRDWWKLAKRHVTVFQAYERYLADKTIQAPEHPFRVFMSEEIWKARL